MLRRCGRLAGGAARLSTSSRALGGDGMPAIIERHGKREVIGYGYNGQPNYIDRVDYPIPAVRFREETPQIKVRVLYDSRRYGYIWPRGLVRNCMCAIFDF